MENDLESLNDDQRLRVSRRGAVQAAGALALAGTLSTAFANTASAEENPPPTDSSVHWHRTPNGTDYYVLGTFPPGVSRVLLTVGNSPDVLIPYFTQTGIYLRRLGYMVVGVDMPSHGTQIIDPVNDKGLEGWVWRLRNGMDFVEDHNKRLHSVVSHLISQGQTKPGMMAVQGTSRGGFLAYHYAVYDDRVKAALGFAPITDLVATPWFGPIADNPLVQKLNVTNPDFVQAIMGIPQFLVIGDRDTLVSNTAAHRWSQQVSDAARNSGTPREIAFHQLSEPIGHTTPKGGQLLGASWLLRVMQGLTPEDAAIKAASNK